jgi:hypothetical protein
MTRHLTPTGRWIVGGVFIVAAALALFVLIITGAWQQ